MNKTRRLITLIILALIVVTSVVVLAACSDDTDPNEYVTGQGNTIKVILDSVKSGVIDYRLKPGSPIPEPGKTSGTTAPIAEGFVFDGYYQGTKNDDGSITYGEKWDFTRKVTEDMTLYGKWLIQYKIRINYVLDGVLQQGQGSETKVANNSETITNLNDPSWSGNTFVQLYSDLECTQELTISRDNPFAHGCTQDNPICNVYAKFIEGRWTLIRTASELLRISSGARLYLMNDIDMSSLMKDVVTDMTADSEFKGIIDGNGHKILNLHYYREGKRTLPVDYTSYCIGLFAQLNGATIRNITFENCSVSGLVQAKNDVYMYGFLAGRATGECKFENISFVNCELKTLQFKISGLSAEDNEAERDNLDTNFFVGYGSDYQPNIVSDTMATVARLVAMGK